jgi:alpha-glucosidase
MADGRPTDRPWWESAVIYQVYPRSCQDSNGDGVGDLAGIVARLDYLDWLGIDAIWLSPIFRSPMADFGYDVADYRDVDPIFGTLGDLDRLVDEVHRRGMRLLLDFVPNHTSDQHPWFLESRSSRDSPRRDWYIWRDPSPDGGPPNGWRTVFADSAWQLDQRTGQFYFHSFLPEQPDLNWANLEVRLAMSDVLRFWFDRGVDGFRIDVVNLLAKGPELRTPMRPGQQAWGNERAIHPIMRELRAVADEYDERLLVGEIWLPPNQLVTYYGSELDELHLPFNFQLLDLAWRAEVLGEAIASYEALLPAGAWPNWVLGNHDRQRIASRVGPEQARVAAMLLLTLRGTPTLYYGDEIGMTDVHVPPHLRRDPGWRAGPGQGRDPVRAPMRWDGSAGAGFTTGTPWLPIGGETGASVAEQRRDRRSMLQLHRRLLRLRRTEPALSVGSWAPLAADGDLLAYEREADGRHLAVCLNLGGSEVTLPLAGAISARPLLSTTREPADDTLSRALRLQPNEGLIVALE